MLPKKRYFGAFNDLPWGRNKEHWSFQLWLFFPVEARRARSKKKKKIVYLFVLEHYITDQRSFHNLLAVQFYSVQSPSHVRLFATPLTAARQASLSITNSWNLPKLMSIESVMPSNHLILCHPLLPLPSIPPSIRVFSNESTLCMRWPKFWSFSLNMSPSNAHPGPISFRMAVHSPLISWWVTSSIIWIFSLPWYCLSCTYVNIYNQDM